MHLNFNTQSAHIFFFIANYITLQIKILLWDQIPIQQLKFQLKKNLNLSAQGGDSS